jgi:hypothetical protein
MELQPHVEPPAGTEAGPVDSIKRRGLFAAVAGLVAAIMMKPKEVAATSGGGTGGNLVIGSNFLNPNTGDTVTALRCGSGNFGSTMLAAFDASGGGGTTANINGLYGSAKGPGSGIIGVTGFANSSGFHGGDFASSGVIGYGEGGTTGVIGVSGTGTGVLGSSSHVGVYGYSTNIGVVGVGQSASAIGLWGETSGATGYAVRGKATGGGIGIFGDANPWAGVFSGGVYINGALTVTGAKSATVSHPDGSLRRLYCVESPESWFEDFGKGKLVNGTACVTLDPDFMSVVNNDDYHVFLTPNGNSKGLYVDGQTAGSFEVREQEGGTSNLAFNYRVVARRKDIAGPRFEKVDAPDFAAAARLKPVQAPPRPVENGSRHDGGQVSRGA